MEGAGAIILEKKMRLPNVGDLIDGPTPPRLTLQRSCPSPPVATTSAAKHRARMGYAALIGNKLTIAGNGAGQRNYWYIPQASGGTQNTPAEAHFCVVPCANARGHGYVISDNYGGCEYHEAYHEGFKIFAFFHVFRGNGQTAQYDLAPGWELKKVLRSAAIASTLGSNWSISCIDFDTNPPTVASKFIRVGGRPNLSITQEDSGLAAYPAPAPAAVASGGGNTGPMRQIRTWLNSVLGK